MKARIRAWGADLSAALGALTGDFSLILIGPGPLGYHAAAPAAEQVARVQDAKARWGESFTFHLFSKDVEYRWDHGTGVELARADDGDCEMVERSVLLARELSPLPGAAALLAQAPQRRMIVHELVRNGAPVDVKLEGLL